MLVSLVWGLGCVPDATPSPVPWSGDQRAVVLLIAWEDEAPTLPATAYEQAFFDPDGLSLRRFLAENSQGDCSLTGEVFDWRTSELRWADMDQADPTAVAEVASDLFEDAFAVSDFDADGNGRIDHLFVMHAGRTDRDRPNPDDVFALGEADSTAVLQSQGVGSVGQEPAIGLYTHEAAHWHYDLRDRYGDYFHGHYGIGVWGSMGLGSWGPSNDIPTAELFRYPAPFRAAAKAEIGWLALRELGESTPDLRLQPVELGGEALQISIGNTRLVLEVRGPHGFSEELPGHGLLLWREEYRGPFERARTALIQADGRDDLANGTDLGERPLPPLDENFGDASDPFPGSEGVTSYADPELGVRIEDIRMDGEDVLFDVVFDE